ncbi:hypothetical protein DFJ73DRAFT_773573 [Zopfochytrium polystomum]|nr:hypothetical protein DFJ73DRAFT_773573 [Zopfochytrium polystomum]
MLTIRCGVRIAAFNLYFGLTRPELEADGTIKYFDTGKTDDYNSLYSIIIDGLLFAVGGVLQAAANGLALLLIGRLFSGLAIGTVSMVVPIYLAVTTVYQLMITLGIFIATCVNSIIIKTVNDLSDTTWRVALANRDTEGLAALAKLRESTTTDPRRRRRPGLRRRLIIGFVNQFFQQYYDPTLFKNMGFASADTVIAFPLANSFINFVFTFPGMIFVDKFGRRPPPLWGAIAQSVAHAGIFVFLTIANNSAPLRRLGRHHLRIPLHRRLRVHRGPVMWLYQAEIFALCVRAKGAGISTMSNWSWNAVIAFAWPKTKGKSLEEIDEVFGDNARAAFRRRRTRWN